MSKRDIDEESLCINCEHSTSIMDTDVCVCDIKGVVTTEGYCKKFKLDLLKIKPGPPKVFKSNDSEIFRF